MRISFTGDPHLSPTREMEHSDYVYGVRAAARAAGRALARADKAREAGDIRLERAKYAAYMERHRTALEIRDEMRRLFS